jgi:N-acetylglucosamine-6-phosphate deacetylase
MPTVAAARVVTPGHVLEAAEVVVDGGTVVEVRPASGPVPDRVLVPGFVDLQVNGIDDVDVATAAGPAWGRLDHLLLAQGVTTWCPTVVTAPLDAYGAALGCIDEAMRRPPERRPHIAGAHLEGPFLGGAPGAHAADLIATVDLDWLAHLPDTVAVMTLAPETARAVDAIRMLAGRGVVVALGHSTATFEQAVAAADAGATLVTHLFNGMAPLHHRRPGLVGAALSDERLAVSVIADLVHVHPAVLGAAFRAKGAGAVVLVTDSVAWRLDTHAGRRIEVGPDGAPRLADGTLAGSALTMDAAVRHLVKDAGVPLEAVITSAATTPARVLGLTDRGGIVAGRRADLVALTPDLQVEAVWVGGELASG